MSDFKFSRSNQWFVTLDSSLLDHANDLQMSQQMICYRSKIWIKITYGHNSPIETIDSITSIEGIYPDFFLGNQIRYTFNNVLFVLSSNTIIDRHWWWDWNDEKKLFCSLFQFSFKWLLFCPSHSIFPIY